MDYLFNCHHLIVEPYMINTITHDFKKNQSLDDITTVHHLLKKFIFYYYKLVNFCEEILAKHSINYLNNSITNCCLFNAF